MFSPSTQFFVDEKRMQLNLNTKVKVFHETISCFMKWPKKLYFMKSSERKVHSVSLPYVLKMFWC